MSVQRDEKGWWLKGSVPNPAGRPSRQVEAAYLDVMLAECSLDKWREICQVAVSDAIGGNVNARRYARDWLGRILLPAIERILVASFNVGIDVSDAQAQMRKLVSMLIASEESDESNADKGETQHG